MGASLEALGFRQVWAVDFEFSAPPGERPAPICMVARELLGGNTIRIFGENLTATKEPPFDVGASALVVAFYASAEMECFLALGWPFPAHLLDLYVEFRNLKNGNPPPNGHGLLGALSYFGLPCMDAAEKDEMRDLALRGGPYTEAEEKALIEYCELDVQSLALLLPRMAASLDVPRALLRGRYMKAVARIQNIGVPMDVEALASLRRYWNAIKEKLIAEIDLQYGVYDGCTFKRDRFAEYLSRSGLSWPHLDSGELDLSDEVFRDMARVHPHLQPLRELRHALSGMRLEELAVGNDGRNRCLLSPFAAKTGRNQPSNTDFIFGPAVWLRSVIKPRPGWGIAYLDWSQQEFGIAAALSGDEAMMKAYHSGDPYLAFAKQARAAPATATKQSHEAVREQYKQCVLAVQYGMGSKGLAARIGQPEIAAKELLAMHRRTYPTYWKWSEAAVNRALMGRGLHTTYGWRIQLGPGEANARSLANFPMQANGAEMLRLACIFATEGGIRVCAPVHDAILVEAPVSELEAVVAQTGRYMEQASIKVLDGFTLRSDAKTVSYPERYSDKRGVAMWNTVWSIIERLDPVAGAHGRNPTCASA